MRRRVWLGWALLPLAATPAAAQGAQRQDFTPEQVVIGQAIYERNCSPCHGSGMADPEGAFDLRKFPHDQHERFVESVTRGKNTMPPWGNLLKPEEVEALWAYVVLGPAGVGVKVAKGTAAPAGVPPTSAPPAEAEPATQNDPDSMLRNAKMVPPFRIFDNLYYVGMDWVSAYVLKTSAGLIMIDSLYGPFTAQALASLRQFGLDPRDIKYLLISHGHFDHAEGAGVVQKASGARVGMTEADWVMLEQEAKGGQVNTTPVRRDLAFKDGDTLTLGDTTLKFYVTPGHTPGVLSMEFPVREGGTTYKAFMFGGTGLNFRGVDRTEMYIQSVQRLLQIPGVQVNIPNHPFVGQVFERARRLAARKPGEPNPFVAPEEWTPWLQSLLASAQKKLADEKQAAAQR